MPLSQRSRTTIFQTLGPLSSEEAIDEMLSYFPARDGDEPASKETVRAEIAELRADLDSGLAELRADLDSGLAELRADLVSGLAGVRVDMAAMEMRLHNELRQMQSWLLGAIVAATALVSAAAGVFN